MKYSIEIVEYYDKNNPLDLGNNGYYLFVRNKLEKDAESEDWYFNQEITEKFKVDFFKLVKDYGGFIDGDSAFFIYKKDAEKCKKALKKIIKFFE